MTALAISNNDMVYLRWRVDQKIPDCLGFTIHREDVATGKSRPLPTWVGFQAVPNTKREVRDSDVWPIQKFEWKDVTAQRGGRFRYRVTPMVGVPTALAPVEPMTMLTAEVSLTPTQGSIGVYFNRGIISTQAVSGALPKGPDGQPQAAVLRDRIDQPGDPLRERLAGDLNDALLSLLKRAQREGGHCYCALYELNDVELIQALLGTERAHIILSNTGDDDGTNVGARQTLHQASKDVLDRMLGSGHIGHNKFVVYTDHSRKPKAVLTGSTNWTATGLCAQTNNAIIFESAPLASRYLSYWQALKKDAAQQGADFRAHNGHTPQRVILPAGEGSVRAWFSPNTTQKSKPANNPPTPADMKEIFDLIHGAKKGVLFLAFIPGSPGIATELRQVYTARVQAGRRLFVRGAVTDRATAVAFNVNLYHRTMRADAHVSSVAGIDDQFSFWSKELSQLGYAVIHDKIVVVDPFTDECAVVTGSHNLGFKASYANDENLVVIRGNRRVAAAYTAHVLDIYDHFRWRWQLQQAKAQKRAQAVWQDLDETDRWQDKYFDPNNLAAADDALWEGA